MSKPDSTPVAAILLIIVLGVVVIGGITGGLLFLTGWFFYESHQSETYHSLKLSVR